MNQKGFTLVELMLAMAFFTFILLLMVTGYVQINRSYVRGLTTKDVQNSGREIMDDVSRAIRGAKAYEVDTSVPRRLCIGSVRYGWNMSDGVASYTNELFNDSKTEKWVRFTRAADLGSRTCADRFSRTEGVAIPAAETILAETMSMQYFAVAPVPGTSSFKIEMVLSTGGNNPSGGGPPNNANDFASWGQNAECKVQTGDQFCRVVRLETVVTARN